MTGIYTIINRINNKIYVGYATDIKKRLKNHRTDLLEGRHKNQHLQNSYDEYGDFNFKFEELVECSKEFLASEEHYWATILNVHDNRYGYNIRPTDPNKIAYLSEETKRKISIANTGKTHSEESKNKCSLGRLGKIHSEESKNKISTALKGRKQSKEAIIKSALGRKGQKYSDATKLKMRASANHSNIKLRKPILQFDLNGKFIQEWDGVITAVKALGFKSSVSPNRKTSKGFIWKWKE